MRDGLIDIHIVQMRQIKTIRFCANRSIFFGISRSVPSSSPSTWASAAAAIDSISSARTMSGFDLVGDSSDDAVQSQSTKSLGEFLKLPRAPPIIAARRSAKRPAPQLLRKGWSAPPEGADDGSPGPTMAGPTGVDINIFENIPASSRSE